MGPPGTWISTIIHVLLKLICDKQKNSALLDSSHFLSFPLDSPVFLTFTRIPIFLIDNPPDQGYDGDKSAQLSDWRNAA